MNKKLVAAALGLAFAAPVFADASNVTVYGRVHQAVVNQSSDTSTGAKGPSNAALENYASRLGVRGTEDLGGGLAVIFAYELGFNTDNSATTSGLGSARHSYLGFKDSKWGTFVAGTQDGGNDSQAPLYNQAQNFLGSVNNNAGDLANVGSSGELAAFGPATPATGATNPFIAPQAAISRTQRTGNSFGYAGNIAGVNVSVRHALGGTNDNQVGTQNGNPTAGTNPLTVRENDLRQTEVAADYKIGGLLIGAGFQRVDRSAGQQSFATTTVGGVTPAAVKSVFQVGSKYTFGDLSVGGLVSQVKLEQATGAGRDDKNSQFALSGEYKIGKGGVYAFYAKAEREDLAANAETKQSQIAYYYDLSKRTRAYAGINHTVLDSGNGLAANVYGNPGGVVAANTSLDTNSVVVGLRHNF